MIIAFELSMPRNNAWNNRWSGQEKRHVKVVNVGTSQKARTKYAALIATGRFDYDFGDGWGACVTVSEVDRAEARKLRAQSAGFCGYDWMIDSIRHEGRIVAPSTQGV